MFIKKIKDSIKVVSRLAQMDNRVKANIKGGIY